MGICNRFIGEQRWIIPVVSTAEPFMVSEAEPPMLGGVEELVLKEAEPIVLNIVAPKNYENKGQ